MTLLVIGINHKTAPISVREKISFSREHKLVLLKDLLAQPDISAAVVVSTCNRTEIYTNTTNNSVNSIIEVILANSTITLDELTTGIYVHKDLAAVEHIMSVACGIDSMVIGEQQILGQMKSAVNLAAENHCLDRHFHCLFQRVFSLAKHVRTTAKIGACPVSVASIAVKLAKETFGNLEQLNVLLLGAGDTIRLTAKYLHSHNLKQLTIASRHLENAKKLADLVDGEAISLASIASYLPKVDIVMSATASEVPILGKGKIESALKARPNKPLFLVDMAVPRDIEAEAAELEQVHLYTIDDLKSVSQSNSKTRGHAAKQAMAIIKEHAAEYMQWLNGLESVDIIKAFRQHVDTIRLAEQDKAYKLLEQGADPKVVIDYLATSFANKLMHNPSIQIRQACEYGRKEVLQTVQELFAISSVTEEETLSDAPN